MRQAVLNPTHSLPCFYQCNFNSHTYTPYWLIPPSVVWESFGSCVRQRHKLTQWLCYQDTITPGWHLMDFFFHHTAPLAGILDFSSLFFLVFFFLLSPGNIRRTHEANKDIRMMDKVHLMARRVPLIFQDEANGGFGRWMLGMDRGVSARSRETRLPLGMLIPVSTTMSLCCAMSSTRSDRWPLRVVVK